MSNKHSPALALAVGGILLGSAAIANAGSFQLTDLGQGYMLVGDHHPEGKCGGDKAKEGCCGGDKAKEGKCGEGKCGADKAKHDAEHHEKCADKGHEGSCGANQGHDKGHEGDKGH